MRVFGSVLLTAGFLSGAYMSVAQVTSVNWVHYGVCAGFMLMGMILLHFARRDEMEQAGEKHTADLDVLRASLANLTEKVRGFEAAEGDEDQLLVFSRVDEELMEDINAFVGARESMIPKFGMNRYAEIMSPFANAERLINRAWSASADGYVDEVRLCIRNARQQLEEASALLE